MREHYIAPGAVPVIILVVAFIYEGIRYVRRGDPPKPWMRLSGWFIRPWAAWALFNLVFRYFWDLGHNNRRTFPFFANLWNNEESLWEGMCRLAGMPTVWIWGGLSLLLLAALLCVLAYAIKRDSMPNRQLVPVLIVAYGLGVMLQWSAACMPKGAGLGDEGDGSLLSCWKVNATMLYAVPVVKSSKHFMRNFVALQPQLRHTIHGLSHPPGAALSMYWLGKAVGAKRMNIRLWTTRIRYAFVLPVFSGLSFFLLYALGRQVFGSHRIGIGAGMLWFCAPSVMSYNTFAQEGVYSVFFIASLLLMWIVVTRERAPWWALVALGLDFYFMVFLNYSWCVATTMFAAFLLIVGRMRKWKLVEYFRRGVVPLGIMTILAAAVLIGFRLNYLTAYRNASEFVNQWYRYNSLYLEGMFYIGGQFDLWLMLGAITASAFLLSLGGLRKDGIRKPRNIFLLIILCVFALPVIFGPNCLRIETARCFSWIVAVPIVFAAHRLMVSGRPMLFMVTAAASSGLTYIGMRLFMDFAP